MAKEKLENTVLIGVDIGGTKISTGLIVKGEIIKNSIHPTPKTDLESSVIMAIILSIQDVWTDEVQGIGIGVPGLVDVKNGIVYDVHNIPSFKNVSLKKQLEETFEVPVYVSNDANSFVAGVKYFGEGKPYDNLVGLTLGTGLGGGIIINGKLHEGVGSGAGEFGYVPFREGIMEHYCSGQFFQRNCNLTGQEVSDRAENGDDEAIKIMNEFGENLGEAIKVVSHTIAPQAVILGGSISRSFDLFKEGMWNSVRKFPYSNVVDNLIVIPAKNTNIAVTGAAALVIGRV